MMGSEDDRPDWQKPTKLTKRAPEDIEDEAMIGTAVVSPSPMDFLGSLNPQSRIDDVVREANERLPRHDFSGARAALGSLPKGIPPEVEASIRHQIDRAEAIYQQETKVRSTLKSVQELVDCGEYRRARSTAKSLPKTPADAARIRNEVLTKIDEAKKNARLARKRIPELLDRLSKLGVDQSIVDEVARSNEIEIGNPAQYAFMLEQLIDRAQKFAEQARNAPAPVTTERTGSDGSLDGVMLGKATNVATDGFVAQVTDLASRAGIDVEQTSDDAVRALFRLEGGRSQQVLFQPAGRVGDHSIVRVLSRVADLEAHTLASADCRKLLEGSSTMVLGNYAIWGKYLVFQQCMLLDGTTPGEFNSIVMTVARLADDAEAKLTGADNL